MSFTKKNSWGELIVFAFAAALSQALWLNFAPIISLIQSMYGVSEDTAGLLLLVFPLIYVFISLPIGKLIDKKGYRFNILLGSLFMALFSFLRIYDKSFTLLLIAQIGIAITQPFIINSISKLVLDTFDKDHEAIATGLGTMGMFLGMVIGMALTPYLIEIVGFKICMLVFSLLSVLNLIACYFVLKTHTETGEANYVSKDHSLISFFKDKDLVGVFTLAFLGLGFFNGLTTWIEPILKPLGISSLQAGIIGGVLIIGGVVGAGIVPTLSDQFKKRKIFLIICVFISLLLIIPFCTQSNYTKLMFLALFQGFFFLPAFSLLLQMCAEYVGETKAGTATGILMLLGNLGGVVVIILMEFLKPPVYLLTLLLFLCLLLSIYVKESHPNSTK